MGAMLPLLAMGMMMGKGKKNGGAALRGFAQGMNNSMNNQTALEVWKANQINAQRKEQQEQAMERIKQNRAYMAKVFEKDPNLWGNQQAVSFLMAGDVEGLSGHLAESGWSLKEEEDKTKYEFKNIGGQMWAVDPYTGEKIKQLGHAGDYDKPEEDKPEKQSKMVVVLDDGKPHVVTYDPYDMANKEKWQDLGLAASAVDPLASLLSGGMGGNGVSGGSGAAEAGTNPPEEESIELTETQIKDMYKTDAEPGQTYEQFKKELLDSGITLKSETPFVK